MHTLWSPISYGVCVHVQIASKSWFDILIAEAIPLEPVSLPVISHSGDVLFLLPLGCEKAVTVFSRSDWSHFTTPP